MSETNRYFYEGGIIIDKTPDTKHDLKALWEIFEQLRAKGYSEDKIIKIFVKSCKSKSPEKVRLLIAKIKAKYSKPKPKPELESVSVEDPFSMEKKKLDKDDDPSPGK